MSFDYASASSYWRAAAEHGGDDPDAAAGVNPWVPLSAHRFGRAGQIGRFLELLAEVPRDADVLDLGCGPGVFSLALADRVGSITGVDVAPGFVEAARAAALRRGLDNCTFEVGSIVTYEPRKVHDAIVLGSVLQYVGDEELRPLLDRLHTATRGSARIYVRVSCAAGGPWRRAGRYPVVYRRPATYAASFEAAGFRVLASESDPFYTFGNLFMLYFGALRILTLGLSRRAPRLEDAIFRGLIRARSVMLDAPERLLNRVPVPLPPVRARCFLLERT